LALSWLVPFFGSFILAAGGLSGAQVGLISCADADITASMSMSFEVGQPASADRRSLLDFLLQAAIAWRPCFSVAAGISGETEPSSE
jgi:hypothetical protein